MKDRSAPLFLFISKGEDSASTRYRATQFFPMFIEAGVRACHVTTSKSPLSYLETLRKAATADVVIVLRKTFPLPYLWLLRKLSRRLVFDFDDAIFCNTDGTPSKTRMSRFLAMTEVSDLVIAGNSYLAGQALSHSRRVATLPTCVSISPFPDICAKPADQFDVVWIGSRSTRKYLLDALPVLREAYARVPNLRLKIVADFDLSDAGLPVLAIPWSSNTEAQALSSAHIGIAPMRDDSWTRGKCALKVLQYMAAGLPVVSSNCGANAEIVIDGENGYLVSEDDSWVNRIVLLAGQDELRARLGAAGRSLVHSHYASGPVGNKLLALLRTLTESEA
jgi:glycosyltransferase involved in cell wall biosynthesis